MDCMGLADRTHKCNVSAHAHNKSNLRGTATSHLIFMSDNVVSETGPPVIGEVKLRRERDWRY